MPRWMDWTAGEQDERERREREREREKKCMFIASKAVGSVLVQSHKEIFSVDIVLFGYLFFFDDQRCHVSGSRLVTY